MATKNPAADLAEGEQKRLALDLLLDAWDTALRRGVAPEILATTAIFCALTDMVDIHGEDPVAHLVQDLPERIRNGEFTLKRSGTA